MKLFTYTLTTGELTINREDGVTQLSIQSNDSSSCTILGNIPFKQITPNAVTLENGQNFTVTTPSQQPLEGVSIIHVSGTVDIVIGF